MKNFLVFRLYGPMAAWGDIAVGETRQSHLYPTKSAIMGLIAAAKGIDRQQEELHRAMSDGYGFAVKVCLAGKPLQDYHTTQVPSEKRSFATRRNELLNKEKLNTILSQRDYRMDALYIIAIWENRPVNFCSLAEMAKALEYPKYTLYLGRKSCPLAIPVEAQVLEANTLLEAFNCAVFKDPEGVELPNTKNFQYYWEDGVEAGMKPKHVFQRRDTVISRRRWQFDIRHEYHAAYSEGS